MSGPEGTPNGVDRLRRIDRLWRTAQMRAATGAVTQADVLALVEIARAARELCDGGQDLAAPFAALRSALARLDSGAAEENT